VRALLAKTGLIVSFAGIFETWTLTLAHLSLHSLPCGQSADCDRIATSSISSLYGIPIASCGFLAFIVLSWMMLMQLQGQNRRALAAGYFLALICTAVNLGLTCYAIFHLHAYCEWCIASNITFAGLSLIFAILSNVPDTTQSPKGTDVFVTVTVFALFFLAGLQTQNLLSGHRFLPYNRRALNKASLAELVPDDSIAYAPAGYIKTAVVFVDMGCPVCHRFVTRLASTADRNRLRIIIRQCPITPPEETVRLAEICETVNDEGKGWDFLLRAFRSDSFTEEDLLSIVRQIGCDAFAKGPRALAKLRVDRDRALAQRLGLHGTPATVLINENGDRTVLSPQGYGAAAG